MPVPSPFPFPRANRVVYSVRGLSTFAALLVAFAVVFSLLVVAYADRNSPAMVAWVLGISCLFVLGAIWCLVCARRVKKWEREYERIMGLPPYV